MQGETCEKDDGYETKRPHEEADGGLKVSYLMKQTVNSDNDESDLADTISYVETEKSRDSMKPMNGWKIDLLQNDLVQNNDI